ncbi:MAG: cupredoxin domain-containing protein [Candidatus Brennerbacteria bacterium]|nr:cupredoxin domain-containing protein [Candidatus Brennerbacteria bacterium]
MNNGNKFYKLLFFGFFLVTSGIVYQKYYRPMEIAPIPRNNQPPVEITMRVIEDKWTWDPAEIRVKAGDLVRLHITNEDPFDHGFAVEAFGINRRLFARRETLVEFLASKAGSFGFYCSVPCGEGHYRQTGILFVEE